MKGTTTQNKHLYYYRLYYCSILPPLSADISVIICGLRYCNTLLATRNDHTSPSRTKYVYCTYVIEKKKIMYAYGMRM